MPSSARRAGAPSPALKFLRRASLTNKPVHIADMRADPAYLVRDPLRWRRGSRRRADVLGVPMLKEGEVVGAIAIYRQEVRPSPTSRSSWSRTSPPRL